MVVALVDVTEDKCVSSLGPNAKDNERKKMCGEASLPDQRVSGRSLVVYGGGGHLFSTECAGKGLVLCSSRSHRRLTVHDQIITAHHQMLTVHHQM